MFVQEMYLREMSQPNVCWSQSICLHHKCVLLNLVKLDVRKWNSVVPFYDDVFGGFWLRNQLVLELISSIRDKRTEFFNKYEYSTTEDP